LPGLPQRALQPFGKCLSFFGNTHQIPFLRKRKATALVIESARRTSRLAYFLVSYATNSKRAWSPYLYGNEHL
jgi:hypothetical protein